MKCPACGDEWPANYCPVCKSTIHRLTSQPEQDRLVKSSGIYSDTIKSTTTAHHLSKLNTGNTDANQAEIHNLANKHIIIGSIWLAVGILITILSIFFYSAGGSFYIITWGAIVYGIIRIIKGNKILNRS